MGWGPQKVNRKLSLDPVIPPKRVETIHPHKNVCVSVHSDVIHNSHKEEGADCSSPDE